MTQINCIGGILGSSGYDCHTRQLANALSKICDVKLTTQIPGGAESMLTDKEVNMIKKKDKGEINLIITSPVHWKLYTTAKRNWCFLIFEGDKIPKSYLTECLNEDIEYIFVASNHCKEALINTIPTTEVTGEEMMQYARLYDKIKLIPHGVSLELFYPKERIE